MSMPGQQGIQLRYSTDLHRPAFENLFVKNIMKMSNSLKTNKTEGRYILPVFATLF